MSDRKLTAWLCGAAIGCMASALDIGFCQAPPLDCAVGVIAGLVVGWFLLDFLIEAGW